MAKDSKKRAAPKAGVGGTVTKEDLIGLMATHEQAASTIGEARGLIGKKVKNLEERGFNNKVFAAIRALTRGKNAAGVTAVLRCWTEYVELMGLNDQGDLEDFLDNMPDTRTAHEKAMDGDEVGGEPTQAAKARRSSRKKNQDAAAVDDVAGQQDLAEKRSEALDMLRQVLKEANDPDAVNIGLEKFTKDHEDLNIEDDALTIATERLEELADA